MIKEKNNRIGFSQIVFIVVSLLIMSCHGAGSPNHDDEQIFTGRFYETDGEEGTFQITFTQTETAFSGTFDVVKNNIEHERISYTISGEFDDYMYKGFDSLGRSFEYYLETHPINPSENILIGSYYDPAGIEYGSIRSTNNNGYNSVDGFVDVVGLSDRSGVMVKLVEDPNFVATTDSNGHYCLYGFSNGEYSVIASYNGFNISSTSNWSFSDLSTHLEHVDIEGQIQLVPPKLLTPADGSCFNTKGGTSIGITFRWAPVNGANKYFYKVWSTYPPEELTGWINQPEISLSLWYIHESGNYWATYNWQVMSAIDQVQSDFSDERSLGIRASTFPCP